MTCCKEDGDYKNPSVTPVRGITDCLWLIIFVCFVFGMVFIAAFAIVYGDPIRLVYGYDSFGNMCGHRNEKLGSLSNSGMDLTNEKYLFYFNIGKPLNSFKICVHECPTHILQTKTDLVEFALQTGSYLCQYNIPVSRYNDLDPLTGKNVSFKDKGPCPELPVYPSTPLLNRCIPQTVYNVTADIIYNFRIIVNNVDLFQQVVSDVYASWKELIILAAVACILSALLLLILHFLVTIVFWIIFIGVGITCCVGTGLLWWTYIDIRNQLDSMDPEQVLEDMVRNERAFLCYAIIATVISVILLSILFCFKREMPKVEILFKEAASCMFDIPSLFFQPVWTLAILFTFFLFWIYIVLSLATAILPNKHHVVMANSSNSTFKFLFNPEFSIVDYIDPSWIRYLWWYYIIALFWMSEVILSCQQMIMAGTIASWYFASDRDNVHCSVWKMSVNVLFYHLGSVAKGSFLISFFKLPRIIITYIKQKIAADDNSNCAKCCEAYCCCCLWTFEHFIKYLSHNAYTVIAINGDNFCPAAKEAFFVIMKQATMVAAINSVGDFVLFLGKCFVTIITGIVGLVYLKLNVNLNFYAIPVLISCIIAYYIAHCVLSLYEMIIDTLTLCYCEKNNIAPEKLRVIFKTRDEPTDELELEEWTK